MSPLPSLGSNPSIRTQVQQLRFEVDLPNGDMQKLDPLLKHSDTNESTPFEPMMYNIPDSKRLNYKLINKNHKDVLASVGSYDPYPPTWPSVTEVHQKLLVKDAWGKKCARFPNKSQLPLGPGSHNPTDNHKPKNVLSPFKSTSKRFKLPETTAIAPGSYEVSPIKVSRRWKPWIEAVSYRLGRMIDPPKLETDHGPSSVLLSKLSKDPLANTKEKMVEVTKDVVVPKAQTQDVSNVSNDLSKVALNPYNQMYLVHSIK
ncbi:hypothetical protein BC833DRAFT_649521 [Globomyces pollinis-pini]|nr:hypothetical protein BC833DRAFT_649521 [Globomyces pollinis-pini]